MSKLIGSHIIRDHPFVRGQTLPDGNILSIIRDHKVLERIRMGPNAVSAIIIRKNGDIENLGLSHNQLTNIGRDLWADALGAKIPAGGQGTPGTASSATSMQKSSVPARSTNSSPRFSFRSGSQHPQG